MSHRADLNKLKTVSVSQEQQGHKVILLCPFFFWNMEQGTTLC